MTLPDPNHSYEHPRATRVRLRRPGVARRSHRWLPVLVVVLLVPLLSPVPVAKAAVSGTLLVSDEADRSPNRSLDGATLSGGAAILVGTPEGVGSYAKVEFYLDDRDRSGSPFSVDDALPFFDFNGTGQNALGCSICPDSPAVLYDSRVLRQGVAHTVTAVVHHLAGEKEVLEATFTVVHPEGTPIELYPPALDQGAATSVAESTKFLYTGEYPPQEGVARGTIEEERAAVVRGRAVDRAGQPLVNVEVTIAGHREYGRTRTREDGWFDLVVNGGGEPLTVAYAKEGMLSAQRSVEVGWADYSVADDVALVSFDAKATTVDLAAVPTGDVAVHRASTVNDADGSRTSTLLVPAGVGAEMVLPDGTRQPLTEVSLRSTEFTVGDSGEEAMPAALPPASAYTYAVDLSVDEARTAGARSVVFSKPLWHYNENFLRFPVGTTVPAGYYDAEKTAWVPSENGLVVGVVSEAGGLANLDLDGDGAAEDEAKLAAAGVTDAERKSVAFLYEPGQSLWRVPIAHFSPWDFNWGFGFPSDARSPFVKLINAAAGALLPNCNSRGSIIGCEDQSLGERVDLVGTGLDLAYSSTRVPGNRSRASLDVAVSGESVPASLKRIEVELEIVGRRISQTLAAVANQRFSYEWDGIDGYGRLLQGDQPATVRVGYVYDAAYENTASFGSFGDGSRLTADSARQEATIWSETQTTLATAAVADSRGVGLGGWTLSAHHAYDPRTHTLMLGDGTAVQATPGLSVIETIAGSGTRGFAGDGGAATGAALAAPGGVAFDAAGNLYVGDQLNDRVRRVARDGTVTTVAGDGRFAYGGDGGPATSASLASPLELAVDAGGALYIADVDNHRVRRVAPDGTITTVAGNGTRGFSGDGGPATQASLAEPTGLALAADGTLYIADFANHRVRKVTLDGTITTVAGTGVAGFSGDGSPATAAQLAEPASLAVDREGNVYIADSVNDRVRRLRVDGRIETVAGTGVFGRAGDGGPATGAQLAAPTGVALDAEGALFVAEQGSDRVRRITIDGTITTAAGSGSRGFSGDGSAAVRAALANARAVGVGPDGAVHVVDADNNRIRRLTPPLPSSSLDAIVVASPDGSVVFEFDREGRHQRTLDALTGVEVLRFEYDAERRLTRIVDGDANATVIERPAFGRVDIVGPFGARTQLSLDAEGYLGQLTNPANERLSASYAPGGLLASFTDARGTASTYEYDTRGRLIAAVGRDAKRTTLARTETASGYRVEVKTPMARAVAYQVTERPDGGLERTTTDATGLRTDEVRAADASTTVKVDGVALTQLATPDPRWGLTSPLPGSATLQVPGQAATTSSTSSSVTLADAANKLSVTGRTDTTTVGTRTWKSVYDAGARTITSTSPEGRSSTLTLDAKGRVVAQQASGVESVFYAYDPRGRVETVTQGQGSAARVIRYVYDDRGRLASVTDPAGRVSSYGYDDADRVTSATGPAGTARASYDASGNIATLTPPGRPASTLTAAVDDRLDGYTLPGGAGSVSYRLNDDRQYSGVVLPGGAAVDMAYDPEGRLRGVTRAAGTTSFAFDPAGRLATASAPSGVVVTPTYSGPFPTGASVSGPVSGRTAVALDAELRPASETVNGANAAAYVYDRDGLVTKAGTLALTRHPSLGHVTATSLAAVATSISLDTFGQLTRLAATTGTTTLFEARTDSHDALGRVVTRTETIGGPATTWGYRYDPAGRLEAVSRDGVEIASYGYDAAGNRTSLTREGVTEKAAYDDADRLMSAGGRSFTHTANGELETATETATGAVTRYRYDLGRLVGVELSDGRKVDYLLDGSGQRVGKRVDGALVAGFLWAGGRVVGELDGSGALVSRFVYGSRAHVPDYLVKAGTTYRVVTDALGSIRLVVDTATGAIAQRIDYDEFGHMLADSAPGFQPFGYAGGLLDRDTGLVLMGARSYDPTLGRFTTRDPVGFSGGANHYAYASSDPINRIDPSGLSAIGCLQDVLGLAGSVPVIGGAFDIANAAIYAGRGKWGDAGLALGSVLLPVSLAAVGGAARAGARWGDDVAGTAKAVGAPNTAGGGVPSVVFSRSRGPGIAQNFDDAVANGAPTRLTRVDAATRDANRRAALRGQSPAPAGQSLDEYPFACSAQGGCGSVVRSVPVGEQSYQGGVLSRFFQDFGVRPGDPFDVMFGP